MQQSQYMQAVAGFGEPFRAQAGPFVTPGTSPYQMSTSSYMSPNMSGFGQDEAPMGTYAKVVYAASLAAAAAGAYHGYKRKGSVGSAVGWFFLAGFFWPIAVPVMLAQGFAQPER